jgi:hypothetical protein
MNAAGLYVPEEVVSATLMASATTGDVLTVKSDDTVHPRTITGAGGIAVTVNADDIEIDGSAISGGSAMAVLYDSGALGSPANAIDTGAAGIAGGHDVLEVWAMLRTDEAVARSTVIMRVNNDSGNNYDTQRVSGVNATASSQAVLAQSSWLMTCTGASCAANVFGVSRTSIPFYTATVAHKTGENVHGNADTTAANSAVSAYMLTWRNTAAITRMSFTAPSTKNFIVGSRVIIYGR